jgi:hypothetical protein
LAQEEALDRAYTSIIATLLNEARMFDQVFEVAEKQLAPGGNSADEGGAQKRRRLNDEHHHQAKAFSYKYATHNSQNYVHEYYQVSYVGNSGGA